MHRPLCVGLGRSLQHSTLLGLDWTVPRGTGPPHSPSGKSWSLGALRKTKPSGPGSDLICARQEKTCTASYYSGARGKSSLLHTRTLALALDKPVTNYPLRNPEIKLREHMPVEGCVSMHSWMCVTNRELQQYLHVCESIFYLFVCAAESTCTSCLANHLGSSYSGAFIQRDLQYNTCIQPWGYSLTVAGIMQVHQT